MTARRRARIGLRREVLLLLPVSMLVLVVLSTLTLFFYSGTVRLLTEQRRAEAALIARQIAREWSDDAGAAVLRRLALYARRAAVVDERGQAIERFGNFPTTDLLAPLEGLEVETSTAVGPGGTLPDMVAGFSRLESRGRPLFVRVDLPAEVLAIDARSLRILWWVVVPVNLLLVALVVLYLRHLIAPYETLLAQARRVGGGGAEEDEISFLVDTFERAVAALTKPAPPSGEEDIAALQRALAPSLESGLLLLDREGQVLALNPVGAELLGLAAPAVGAPVGDILAGRPELLAIVGQAVASGKGVQRQEVTLEAAGGRTLGLTVHALRRDDGGVRGFLILFVDLTATRRRREEERLEEGLAQLGELAAGVAHELRNSLATLRGYLTLVERRPDEESITDYLAEIRREGDHLSRVVEDFLTFARPESARVEVIDLPRLARKAAADPALEGVRVEVSVPAGAVPRIRGDAQLLERAVRNLLHNAAEAERPLRAEPRLGLSLEATDGGVELAVEDRGPGVPAEVRKRLFQPFVTGRPGGVGLGLSLAHRIVSLHGSTLRLEDREGGGTRAVILFRADAIVTEGNKQATPADPSPLHSPPPNTTKN